MTKANLPKAVVVLFASGAALTSCGKQTDTVFSTAQVSFAQASSSAVEATGTVPVELILSAPSTRAVEARVQITGGGATAHDRCGSRDFSLTEELVTFAPGETSATLTLEIQDDATAEMDEPIVLSLAEASGITLGETTEHEHLIVDDDRGALVDVRADFGASGDGNQDDTVAIQAAIAQAAESPESVVYFPAGSYRVTSLELDPAANYAGSGATLVQAPAQPADAVMLRLEYAGAEDSRRVVLQGLSLSGARDQQGPFDEWQLQESSLLLISGDPASAGRLEVELESLRVSDSGGNGLVLGTNVVASVCDLVGQEVFTDVLKLRGGHTELDLWGATGSGTVGTTGIALGPTSAGYGDDFGIVARLSDLELQTGDLEIDVRDGSEVAATRVRMARPPLYLGARDSTLRITDSELAVGPPFYRFNRIVAPADVLLESVVFVVHEFVDPSAPLTEGDRTWAALGVTWDDVSYAYSEDTEDTLLARTTGQSLVLRDCRFTLSPDVEGTDVVYVASTEPGDDGTSSLELDDATIDAGFSATLAPTCSGCVTGSP